RAGPGADPQVRHRAADSGHGRGRGPGPYGRGRGPHRRRDRDRRRLIAPARRQRGCKLRAVALSCATTKPAAPRLRHSKGIAMRPVRLVPTMLGAALLASQAVAAEPEACGKVRFSEPGWTDITATTASTRAVLEALGYQTEAQVLA